MNDLLEDKNRKIYINKQRTLVFTSRGITDRSRHLMNDLRDLLPHSKKEPKLDEKRNLLLINEICDMKNCNNCIFFEPRKNDLYLWVARIPSGPSMRFLVTNIHTMAELKLTGNCIKGSRPLLVFDKNFESVSRLKLVKELFSQVFGSPRGHPKTKPFVDHVFSFFYIEKRIWFRNYQLVYDVITNKKIRSKPVLVEIGPRMVLQPLKILSGSFSGRTLWINKTFVPPQVRNDREKKRKANRYIDKYRNKRFRSEKKDQFPIPLDKFELQKVFTAGPDFTVKEQK